MTLKKILEELKRIRKGGIIPTQRIYIFINYTYIVFKNHNVVEERTIKRDITIDELLKIDFLNLEQEAKDIFKSNNQNTFKFSYYEMIGEEEEGNGTSQNFELIIY